MFLDEEFDFNETATAPATQQEFLMENLCGKSGQTQGSYQPPATRSASTRWKRLHEQSMMLRLDEMHVIKKQNAQLSKDAARKIIRKIPVEVLAREWLSKEDATVDMRAFLVDQVLPTLILGVERLLKEVDEKGLSATNVFQPEFNPINFLAQYLMRNNPRFSNFAEASPYVRGLREVSEEIKQELFTFEDNRLARIKAEARRKRHEREKVEQQIREERERRQQQLIVQFQEWNVPTDNNRVELSLLQNALRSFAEIAEQLPAELREVAKFGHALEPTDETGRTLAVKEFAQYISLFVEDLPIEVFEQFMVHMSKCAAAHRAAAERENRRIILTNLFLLCDHGGRYNYLMPAHLRLKRVLLGLLDRHRILTLFEQFWDLAKDTKEPKGTLRNPRKWPVIEVDEVDDIMFEAFEEDGDGGLTEQEAVVAAQQLGRIQQELNKQAMACSVRDKAALEKWKMEQLSEKSEGMRQRLYRYGPRDFLNLVTNYTLRETLECPVIDLDMTSLMLMEPHDLVGLTLAVTKEERDRMFCRDVMFGEEEAVVYEYEDAKPEPETKSQLGNDGASVTEDVVITTSPVVDDAAPDVDAMQENSSQDVVAVRGNDSDASNDRQERDDNNNAKENTNTNRRSSSSSSAASSSKTETDSADSSSAEPSRPSSPKFPGALRHQARSRKKEREKAKAEAARKKRAAQEGEGLSGNVSRARRTASSVENANEEPSPGQSTSRRRRRPPEQTSDPLSPPSSSSATTIPTATERYTPGTLLSNALNALEEDDKQQQPSESGSGLTSTTSCQSVEDLGEGEDDSKQTSSTSLPPISSSHKRRAVNGAKPKKRVQFSSDCKDGDEDGGAGAMGEADRVGAAGQKSKRGFLPDIFQGMRVISARPRSICRDDVDITAELAGDGNKSALKRVDPVTGATATGRASVTFAGNTAFDRERTVKQVTPADLTIQLLSMPCAEFAKMLLKDDNLNNRSINAKVDANVKFDVNANSCNRVRNVRITTNSRSQSQMSAFDESVLNVSQFVQLTETFLGHDPLHELFTKLVHYLKEGYEETEEEKMERLVKARKEAISAKRKLLMDNLFEKWDNDGSGFLEMEDVQEVMFRYKDGQEIDSIKRAQQNMRKRSKFHDARLSKREFRQFVEMVTEELPGAESFEAFVEFLTNSVERSYAERIRGEARKKWLQQIIKASQVSGTCLEPVYKAVFQALYKDAETHGGEKRISASISMLERNLVEPQRGDLLLRYSACTPEDCQYMLGKALFKNMKGISFQCVESGKPIHVPRVANHGNVYFWNYDRMTDDREGSFIVCPLKDRKKRVFGVLGIDTLCDPHKKAIFITHEIQFFQGVAKAFSIAYHNVDMRRKLLRITESAISWIQRRCPHIAEINVYMVEPAKGGSADGNAGSADGTGGSGGSVLRKMMTTDRKGQAIAVTETVRLERKDNLFRDYLFKCMDNSETVTADAYGERHTASPLRDNEGKAIGVVDISIGDMRRLPPYENKEAQRMLRLLQMAHREITKEADGDETTRVLEAEKDDTSRMDIMFDRLMLMELRENVARLDPQSFAELKSYHEPPRVIHDIIRAALAVFNVEKAGEGAYDDWNITKTFINNDLVQQIKAYDPTVATELIKSEVVERFLKATFTVPHGEVAKYGSIPARQLYNWVFVCISLIEHTRKMRENAEGNVLVSAGGAGGSPHVSRPGSSTSKPGSGGAKRNA